MDTNKKIEPMDLLEKCLMEKERYEALMRKTDWYFNLDDPRSGSIVQYECLRKKQRLAPIHCGCMKMDNRLESYAYKIKKPLDLEKLRERLNEEEKEEYKKYKALCDQMTDVDDLIDNML